MNFFLGVDGGGSKTLVTIVDEHGQLLGTGLAGPSNFNSAGLVTAQKNLHQAVTSAKDDAGVGQIPLRGAHLGLAGVVSATDRGVARNLAEGINLMAENGLGISDDVRIALAGGLAGRPGVVLIAGTGTSCMGIDATNKTARAGGLGHLISDEGSGYWLGRKALQAAAQAFDRRGPETALLRKIQDRLALSHFGEVTDLLYRDDLSTSEIARLAPLLIEAATTGDEVSLNLLREGSLHLAKHVQAVAECLGFADRHFELVLVGGLLQPSTPMTRLLRELLKDYYVGCEITGPRLPPVLGACLTALQAWGMNGLPNDIVLRNLQQAAEQVAQDPELQRDGLSANGSLTGSG